MNALQKVLRQQRREKRAGELAVLVAARDARLVAEIPAGIAEPQEAARARMDAITEPMDDGSEDEYGESVEPAWTTDGYAAHLAAVDRCVLAYANAATGMPADQGYQPRPGGTT